MTMRDYVMNYVMNLVTNLAMNLGVNLAMNSWDTPLELAQEVHDLTLRPITVVITAITPISRSGGQSCG